MQKPAVKPPVTRTVSETHLPKCKLTAWPCSLAFPTSCFLMQKQEEACREGKALAPGIERGFTVAGMEPKFDHCMN